jgi:MFS family permease
VTGTIARAREALRSADFRRLFAIRIVSQSADGLFQAALIASVVFAPAEQRTTLGFAIATLVVSLPFSVVGPFTGVFIDRWSRRKILVVAPLLRALLVWLALFNPEEAAVPFYLGALWVLSVNRFYLATAVTVVPRLVATEDLLIANSISIVGGTVALLAGVFAGGWLVELVGQGAAIALAGAQWIVASLIASRISTPLRRLARTPRALGPITSITLDQMGQGIVLVLSLFFFRERLDQGIASFSNLVGAGGVGVLAGIVTVGKLEEHFAKERIVAGAFFLGGLSLLAVSTSINAWSVLLASFAVGLTFAWKKIPVDTLVQEALPDGYRGRVFAVYDVAYNVSRIVAAFLAIPLVPALGEAWTVAAIGVAFVLWSPVLPRWIGRVPELRIRFYEGGRAEEEPRALTWGGAEETVTVERRWLDERYGERRMRYRLALEDGTVIEVSRGEGDPGWRLDRELG